MSYASEPSIWADRQQVLAIPLTEACYSFDHGECAAVECECACHYETPVWPTNGRPL